MLLLIKNINEARLSGNIAKVNLQKGPYGPFGTIRLAMDNGSYNKQAKKFVERTDFINIEVSGNAFFSIVSNPQAGDRIMIFGKVLTDNFIDKQTQLPRESTFVKCTQVLSYTSVEDKKKLQAIGLLPLTAGNKPLNSQTAINQLPVNQYDDTNNSQLDEQYAEYVLLSNQNNRA